MDEELGNSLVEGYMMLKDLLEEKKQESRFNPEVALNEKEEEMLEILDFLILDHLRAEKAKRMN